MQLACLLLGGCFCFPGSNETSEQLPDKLPPPSNLLTHSTMDYDYMDVIYTDADGVKGKKRVPVQISDQELVRPDISQTWRDITLLNPIYYNEKKSRCQITLRMCLFQLLERVDALIRWAPGGEGYCTISVATAVGGGGKGRISRNITEEADFTRPINLISEFAGYGRELKEIKNGHFCKSLESITLPESVTTIGDTAFHCCTSLKSVTLPNSVKRIEMVAFHKCTSLVSITLPDSVKWIASFTFCRCSSLKSIKIPNSVMKIGRRAFSECSSLTSITLPNTLETIGVHAFSKCPSLTSINIPDSVKKIKDSAFSGCTSLESITLHPDTEVAENAFPPDVKIIRKRKLKEYTLKKAKKIKK